LFAALFTGLAAFVHPDGMLFDAASMREWFQNMGTNLMVFLFCGGTAIALFASLRVDEWRYKNVWPVLIRSLLILLGYMLAIPLVQNGGGFLWSGGLAVVCALCATYFWPSLLWPDKA